MMTARFFLALVYYLFLINAFEVTFRNRHQDSIQSRVINPNDRADQGCQPIIGAESQDVEYLELNTLFPDLGPLPEPMAFYLSGGACQRSEPTFILYPDPRPNRKFKFDLSRNLLQAMSQTNTQLQDASSTRVKFWKIVEPNSLEEELLYEDTVPAGGILFIFPSGRITVTVLAEKELINVQQQSHVDAGNQRRPEAYQRVFDHYQEEYKSQDDDNQARPVQQNQVYAAESQEEPAENRSPEAESRLRTIEEELTRLNILELHQSDGREMFILSNGKQIVYNPHGPTVIYDPHGVTSSFNPQTAEMRFVTADGARYHAGPEYILETLAEAGLLTPELRAQYADALARSQQGRYSVLGITASALRQFSSRVWDRVVGGFTTAVRWAQQCKRRGNRQCDRIQIPRIGEDIDLPPALDFASGYTVRAPPESPEITNMDTGGIEEGGVIKSQEDSEVDSGTKSRDMETKQDLENPGSRGYSKFSDGGNTH